MAATGCYTYDQVPFFFFYRGPALSAALGTEVPDPMVDMFVADITEGIADTGVKAAFLKCAIDHQGMTDGVARVMRAVARAHRTTGAPSPCIPIRTPRPAWPPRRCCATKKASTRPGWCWVTPATARTSTIERAGRRGLHPRHGPLRVNVETTFETRADTVVEMCRRGYADRMVLAHDVACYLDWIDPNVMAMMTQWSYLHIYDEVLPYLREHGVTEDQINTMLVEAPRSYFEHNAAY